MRIGDRAPNRPIRLRPGLLPGLPALLRPSGLPAGDPRPAWLGGAATRQFLDKPRARPVAVRHPAVAFLHAERVCGEARLKRTAAARYPVGLRPPPAAPSRRPPRRPSRR